MRDYQQAVIELGFLHSRYLRGVPPPDFAGAGTRLRCPHQRSSAPRSPSPDRWYPIR